MFRLYRKKAAVMLYAGAEGEVCVWVDGWVLVQCAKPNQNSTSENTLISFWHCMYIRTHALLIIYIHSFHSNTLVHTQTTSPWHFHCKTITKKNKRPQSSFSLTPLSEFPVTAQTPPPPVGTATVNLWHCMSLFSTHSRNRRGGQDVP